MLHAKAVQQRDQARPALILDAALFFDPSTNFTRRPRQRLGDPGLQSVLLLVTQAACAALVTEARQALDPVLAVQAMPRADGVVVQQKHLRDRFAAHTVVQQHQRIRAPGETMRGRPVSSQFDEVLPRFAVQEPRSYHRSGRIRLRPLGKGAGAGFSQSRGIASDVMWVVLAVMRVATSQMRKAGIVHGYLKLR